MKRGHALVSLTAVGVVIATSGCSGGTSTPTGTAPSGTPSAAGTPKDAATSAPTTVPTAAPTAAPTQTSAEAIGRYPTCAQALRIVGRWTPADRAYFDKDGNGRVSVGGPWKADRSFTVLYADVQGEAHVDSYAAGSGWRNVTGGGTTDMYYKDGNFTVTITGKKGTPVRCE